MLSKHNHRRAFRGIILTSLLTLLSSCANSEAIESLISADPDLQSDQKAQVDEKNKPNTKNTKANKNNQTAPEDADTLVTEADTENPAKSSELQRKTRARNRAKEQESSAQQTLEENKPQTSELEASESENLLVSFPDTFPVYPQAELAKVESREDQKSGTLVWKTDDNRQAVADYYQAELTTDDWKIIKPFNFNPKRKIARAIAVKDDLRVELSLRQQLQTNESTRPSTELTVVYNPVDEDIPRTSISRVNEQVVSPKQSDQNSTKNNQAQADLAQSKDNQNSQNQTKAREDVKQTQKQDNRSTSATAQKKGNAAKNDASDELESASNNLFQLADTDFTDLDEVPTQLQQPIESVAALSILTPYTGQSNVELSKFAPNETITRGEYARWLIDANNRYYADNPGKKIYVPAKTSQPAFQDVKASHPDFAAIQSLAEAGLIPSRLTEDSTNISFNPNAPLTREDLVTWKVPLDTRQSLPKASIEAIKESWGFRDAAKIDPNAIQALYADFQNGDRANIRRMFGYTTLFQPKKPVTRAEAAASLWYFGFQGDGISAKELLESETETKS